MRAPGAPLSHRHRRHLPALQRDTRHRTPRPGTGGRFNAWQRSLEGSQARQGLAHFQVDKLLLGVCGIDPNGLTCTSEEEASLKHAMMGQATQVIMLAGATKFQRAYLHRLCGFDRIDVLVTDEHPPEAVGGALATLGAEVIIAEPKHVPVAANG